MPKRYFRNVFPPFNGEVVINRDDWMPRIQHLVKQIIDKQGVSSKDCDGGLYVGAGGVGYMLWYISNRMPDWERGNMLTAAQRFLRKNLEYYDNRRLDTGSRVGFLLGRSGVSAVSAALEADLSAGDTSKLDTAVQRCREFTGSCAELSSGPDPLGCGSDEVLVGRAGYILGALWLRETLKRSPNTAAILNQHVPTDSQLSQLCDLMVECGRNYSKKTKSPCPLMYQYYETEYLGAAHGLCGILQALMTVPNYLASNSSGEKDVRGSIDYLLSIQTPEGNFPCAMDEVSGLPNSRRQRPPEDDLVHWCHGAPGTIYLLGRAHFLWGGGAGADSRYLQAALKCGDCVWEKGLLKKGPGICHGIAGSGYVFLLLYRLTGDKLHLYRAAKFAEFLFSQDFQQARIPDCPLSLYEGWAGTVCFLVDLVEHDSAAFPFSDIF